MLLMLLENPMVYPVRRFVIALFTLFIGLNISVSVQATDMNGGVSRSGLPKNHWGLGVVALGNQKPYYDIDPEVMAFPVIYYENRFLQVSGPFIDIKVPDLRFSERQHLELTVPIRYSFNGYTVEDTKDAPILNGMKTRDDGFWAGAKIQWKNPVMNLAVEWLSDASNKSQGQQFKMELDRTWRISRRLLLTPRVAANWFDDSYVDYYYGVMTIEAQNKRPAYVGEAGISIEYGMRGIYMIDTHHSLFLDIEASDLATEIKNSPLVDGTMQKNLMIGYRYQF